MTGGYVKLFRSIESWEWYQDTNTKVLFLHCLIRANHKPKKWRGRTIDTGMFVTSYAKLSDELRLSVRQIRVAIDHLKMTGELTHQTTNEYSVITVVKWGDYQGQDDDDDKPNDKPSVTQTTTNKNDKKEKNIRSNDNNGRFTPPTIDEVSEYVEKMHYKLNPIRFISFYASKDWMVGKNKMKDWRKAADGWEARDNKEQPKGRVEPIPDYEPTHTEKVDIDALRERIKRVSK